MILFGLTGGIGTGKSVATGILQRHGISMIDTDQIARALVEPGQPALLEVVEAFGVRVLNSSGQLRRDELARIVFSDANARSRLEEILHPRIRAQWRQTVEAWRVAGHAVAGVVIPLLFETNAAVHFDVTVSLACTARSQNERLLERGWSADQIACRLAAQWSMARKMDLATFVVWTEATLDVHEAQLLRILKFLAVG